ncbi:MFS transporter [uncultured Alistipes sp.]|uniref:MFS transporter n=1 Tax=uncultured Alistipes sp. TaxID=538949 RepID=UPI0025CF1743|nr:MFS transporter [uncultured Alistipes sp.]
MDRNGNEERLWNREYGKMMCSNFMLFFSFYLLSPLLPIYLAERFGSDKDTIGLVLSGYVIAALLVRPFSGFIVDTFDRRKVLMVCFFLFFICFAGYLGAVTLPLFAVVRTFHGLPFGSATVANSTAAIDALPSSRRNEGIGYYGLSNNLAMAVAPSAGIWLYSLTDDFRLLFWISLIVAGIGFYCTTTVRLPARPPVEGKPRLSLDRFFLTRAWLMAANILLFGLCWGVMGNYVSIYGKEVFGITNGAGVFFALLSIGLVISRLYGAKSLREGRLAENALQGAGISSVGYTLFFLSPGEWAYYGSALLIGLGNGRMYPAFLNMFISVARNDQRGTANSTILTSWDLGMGLGIFIGGVLIEYAGYAAAFGVTACSQIAGALLLLFRTRRFFRERRLR